MLFLLVFLVGLTTLIISLVNLLRYNGKIKKLGDVKISEIDNEMNNPNSFNYEKANLFLTENYIINFYGGLNILSYKDIMWMYPFEQRMNGIKTCQSIKVLMNNGKTYNIANIDLVTKSKKEIYNEIWDTIISKNSTMLIGYTKENIKAMKDKVNEIKRNKKGIL